MNYQEITEEQFKIIFQAVSIFEHIRKQLDLTSQKNKAKLDFILDGGAGQIIKKFELDGEFCTAQIDLKEITLIGLILATFKTIIVGMENIDINEIQNLCNMLLNICQSTNRTKTIH